jgi:hypothetical protein
MSRHIVQVLLNPDQRYRVAFADKVKPGNVVTRPLVAWAHIEDPVLEDDEIIDVFTCVLPMALADGQLVPADELLGFLGIVEPDMSTEDVAECFSDSSRDYPWDAHLNSCHSASDDEEDEDEVLN